MIAQTLGTKCCKDLIVRSIPLKLSHTCIPVSFGSDVPDLKWIWDTTQCLSFLANVKDVRLFVQELFRKLFLNRFPAQITAQLGEQTRFLGVVSPQQEEYEDDSQADDWN